MKFISSVASLLFAGVAFGQPPQSPARPPQAPSLEERVRALEAKISVLEGRGGPPAGNPPVGLETWLINGRFVQVPAGRWPADAGATEFGGTFGGTVGGNCANGSCGGPSSGGRRGLFGRR